MNVRLCLEGYNTNLLDYDSRDLNYLNSVVERYVKIGNISNLLSDQGWDISVHDDDEHFYIYCKPPMPISSEAELNSILESKGIDVGGYGFFEDDVDFDYYPNKDVAEEGWEECEITPLMTRKIADSIIDKNIQSVDLIEDYKVVFNLSDGRKLVYNEEVLCFNLE